MPDREWDTIVLGAGVLGCATAMHVKGMAPDLRVLLLERHPRPGMGNTRRSVALFRDLFTSRTNRVLAGATIAMFDHLEGALGQSIGLRRFGYYWLMDASRREEVVPLLTGLEGRNSSLEVHGRDEVVESLGEHLDLAPGASVGGGRLPDVEAAVLAPNAGTLSPTRLARWYEREFRAHGGEVEYGFHVDRIVLESERGGPHRVWEGARVAAVEGPSGPRHCVELVVAAGVWTPSLLDPLGVDCLVKPQTRQAFGLKGPGAEALHKGNGFPEGLLPVTVMPVAGIYLKPVRSQRMLVAGCADTWGRPYWLDDDPSPEDAFLGDQIRPVVEAYLPGLKGSTVPVKWAGQYHYNTVDGNPNVFKTSNLTAVVGASGSGIMKSDSIGRVAAAVHLEEPTAELFDGQRVQVSDLGIHDRRVEPERLII
jgi:glycine/D-amino acid oxidase-like deaminating enzyme